MLYYILLYSIIFYSLYKDHKNLGLSGTSLNPRGECCTEEACFVFYVCGTKNNQSIRQYRYIFLPENGGLTKKLIGSVKTLMHVLSS